MSKVKNNDEKCISVIFDLDDTLYDCTGQLKDKLIYQSVYNLSKLVNNLDVTTAYQDLLIIRNKHPCEDYFKIYLNNTFKNFDANKIDEFYNLIVKSYLQLDLFLPEIKLFTGCQELLEKLKNNPGLRLFLLTKGGRAVQNKKIGILKIRNFFEKIYILDETDLIGNQKLTKLDMMQNIINENNLDSQKIIVIGDRPNSELIAGQKLGAITIQYKHGVYQNIGVDEFKPDFIVDSYSKLSKIFENILLHKLSLHNLSNMNTKQIVCIGGGTGQPILLKGIKNRLHELGLEDSVNLISVVSMTDSGRSSGRLRALFGCPPPGDCRNCLTSLAVEKELSDLMQYRFNEGELLGHSLGNLLLVGLYQMHGQNMSMAISKMSKILQIQPNYQVLPVCNTQVDLCCETTDGEIIKGEVNVRSVEKSGEINKIWVEHSNIADTDKIPKIHSEVIDKLMKADLIILGPGSFWTSVMCNLMYQDMIPVLKKSAAKIIWIANLTTQPGQTDGMSLQDHCQKIYNILGDRLDYVLVNNRSPNREVIEMYHEQGVDYIEQSLKKNIYTLLAADLIEDTGSISKKDRNLWNKQDCLRHHPEKLAQTIVNLI